MTRVVTLTLAALLVGCGQLEDYYTQQTAAHMPTIILPAGTKVRADGLELILWGNDVCPDAEGLMGSLFGHLSDTGKSECIAIQKGQQNVTVHMASRDSGMQTEQWAIQRNGQYGEHLSLVRPNGTVVGPRL